MKNTVNIGRAALFIAGAAVIAILAAALLIFLSVKADKAENEKDYIPFIGTTELPEVIAVDDSHEYRRRLVSNWRISEIQSDRAAVEDINKEHPRVVGSDENMGISDLDGNMILPAEYRDATITDAGCLKTWAKGGGCFTYYDLEGKVLETSYSGFIDKYEHGSAVTKEKLSSSPQPDTPGLPSGKKTFFDGGFFVKDSKVYVVYVLTDK